MPTDEIIIRLFCMVDDALRDVNNRSDAHLHPSEVVTIGLLFSLKGGRYRAFYRWLDANYRQFFPRLPELSRLLRLLRDYSSLAVDLLAQPSFFTVVDTYGIELIHPRREGRSKRQIGKKGKSNGRWIVGIKLAWLINDQGEVVDWAWTTANEADNTFRPLAMGYDGETIALADLGFREKDAPPSNIHCCERGTWNERFTIETNLSWVTELFDAKKMYHRVKSHLEARLWYLAALINCLLRLTEQKRSLAAFVI
jgi:transposase